MVLHMSETYEASLNVEQRLNRNDKSNAETLAWDRVVSYYWRRLVTESD